MISGKTLKIHNWEKWQSYRRDRGQPPWIKIHREVMRNIDWVSLTDAQRGQLVAIWLLAADHDGVIPASPALIKKLCYMEREPDLKLFISLGLIEDDAKVTSRWRQHDVTETEAETETETETEYIGHSEANDHASDKGISRFGEFWSVYPRKVKKAPARQKWKAKKLDAKADTIIADVKRRLLEDKRWREGYIPDPTTYISQERWTDEIETGQNRGQRAPPRTQQAWGEYGKQVGLPARGGETWESYIVRLKDQWEREHQYGH